MDLLINLAEFAIKAGLVVVSVITIVGFIIAFLRRDDGLESGQIVVLNLNERINEMRQTVKAAIMDEKVFKEELKREKKKIKDRREDEQAKIVFVLDFSGDIEASAVSELREQVSALVAVARKQDEVVLRLESPGGLLHEYGLAAAQLVRLRDAGIPLTICVDKIAASGGYMMAAVANRLIASPFALLGSIGVIITMPNFSRLLKKYQVDYLELYAGEYKSTISTMGEITEKGLAKSNEELAESHRLFKQFLTTYRPQLDMDKIATGEAWYGLPAQDLNLADELRTSDDYLLELAEEAEIYKVEYQLTKTVREKLAGILGEAMEFTATKLWRRVEESSRTKAQ